MTTTPIDTDTLRTLCCAHGVSGYEDDVIGHMARLLRPLVDELRVDRMGSVIGVRHGSRADGPRIMFFAHMDEVGFMVRRREEDGTVRLTSVAGLVKALPGAEIQLRTTSGECFSAIVGIKSAHLTSVDEYGRAERLEDLTVYPVADAADRIDVGSTASFAPGFLELSGGLLCSKALDDRAGCYALVEAARRLHGEALDATIAFVGTVQEETSCDGAVGPARFFEPDLAVAVDGTVAYDTPDTEPLGEVVLGGGPVIARMLQTRGLNGWTANPKAAAWIERVARAAGIPTQRDAVHGLMSDAKSLRLIDVPSAVIGIPMRCKHSPAEIIARSDLARAVELIVSLCRDAGSGLDLTRG